MSWVAVGVGVAGAATSLYSSNKASGAQKAGADAANGLQQQQYNDTVDRNAPFVAGGTSAYNELLSRLGLAGSSDTNAGYGTLGKVPTSADVMATPGYQFGLDQGQNQLNRQLNASGMNYSGAQLKAAAQYGTNYATTKYDNAFQNNLNANNQAYNQLIGTSQLGQASANNTAAAGQNYANQAGANTTGAANSQAASDLANGQYVNNALNQGTSIYRNSGSYSPSGGMTIDTGGSGMPSSYNTDTGGSYHPSDNYGFADGGPVRVEPKVGTYSPVPGGGGGGLSREALMQALIDQSANRQAQKSGIGLLPANPLANPRAILVNQEQQAGSYAWGGAVHGPGTQTSDSIPARLSNGEHVIQAPAVTALGDGSNEVGQQKLNMLRAMLMKGKQA